MNNGVNNNPLNESKASTIKCSGDTNSPVQTNPNKHTFRSRECFMPYVG